MKAREDAQLHGLIDATPEGAVRDERVDPATQGVQALPALDRTAVRRGWATPDEKKPKVVDRLVEIVEDPASDPYEIIASARALMAGDQKQWERDNADLAGKTKGSSEPAEVSINIETIKAGLEKVEEQLGRRIGMPPAMQQIEDAAEVLPPELDTTN
jgi:hypothetical protein